MVDSRAELKPGVIHPIHSDGLNFLVDLLATWRDGGVACILADADDRFPAEVPLPPDAAHLKRVFTTPREYNWAVFSANQLLADVRQLTSVMKLNNLQPGLAVVPAKHSYGFSSIVLPLLLLGVPIVWPADNMPQSIQAVLRWAGDTNQRLHIPAVPALWGLWYQASLLDSSVTGLAVSAGAALPLDLEQKVFAEYGIKIHNFLGCTECGGISFDASEEPRTDAGFVGTVIPGVRVEADDSGCLNVSGEAVAMGYWPENDANALANQRFASKDRCIISAEGLKLTGRTDKMLNLAGRKVIAEILEKRIEQIDGVQACVIIKVPTAASLRGDLIAAIIELEPDTSLGKVRLQAVHLLADWQMPRRWREFPGLSHKQRKCEPSALQDELLQLV